MAEDYTPTNHLRVEVTVDSDELREWAGKHADAGHHGVAHVLFQAAAGAESITEQHDREVKAAALREGADALGHAPSCYPDPDRDPYVGCACRLTFLYARADRIERGEEP